MVRIDARQAPFYKRFLPITNQRVIDVSYDHATVANAVKTRLLEAPRSSLDSICNGLSVERHTVRRALQSTFGLNFRQLQRLCLLQRATELQCGARVRSGKEIAFELGYSSPQSLSRLRRRST